MNLYLRYFDKETLAHSVEEAVCFLRSIREINVTPELENDIRIYAKSDVFYPKRYKLRPRVYFIIIKTEAATMLDFKQKKALRPSPAAQKSQEHTNTNPYEYLYQERYGWYEGELNFKRVVMIRETGKHEYRDTRFVVRCKAVSGAECYQRMIENLRLRVDPRSQFPSIKGDNFKFRFLGLCK